jgi:hypothetical protein
LVAGLPISISVFSDKIAFVLNCGRPTRGNGDHMDRFIEYIIHDIMNPSFAWVLNHPIISVVAVVALIYFSTRNYRML